MTVEGNAPIVTLQFKRPDGTLRQARFLFDTGGGAIIFDAGLAADLGLKPIGPEIVDDGQHYVLTDVPSARIGRFWLKLGTSKAAIHVGAASWDTRERVEGFLPGKALEPYQVVLDYPRHLFSVAASGCIKHRGYPVNSPFLPQSGHPSIVVSVQGNSYGMLLDTGTRVTLARRDLLEAWSAAHPDWPTAWGAAGAADMPDGDGNKFLLRIPDMVWGRFHIKNVLVVSRSNDTYSPTSYETREPIVGALGGNVLKGFRIEIDYPHGKTYLEQIHEPDADDMNTVGLVLDVDAAGRLIVRAIASTAAESTKKNVLPGDIILQIGGKRETPWTIVDASQALSGKVGTEKQLLIRRHGMEIHTSAFVAHLL